MQKLIQKQTMLSRKIIKSKTAQTSQITKTASKNINSQLQRKLKLVKSQLRLKSSNLNRDSRHTNHNVNTQMNIKSIVAQNATKGKTVQFLDSRRESILNSQYNKRKTNLLKITKQNRKIYERINSQKSNYSSRVLNKSYDSVSSSRLSKNSRISRKSLNSRNTFGERSSRAGGGSNKGSRVVLAKNKKVNQPVLQVQNINSISEHQLSTFNKIFSMNKADLPPKPPKQCQSQPRNKGQKIGLIQQADQQYQNICFKQQKSRTTHLHMQSTNKMDIESEVSKNILVRYQFTPDRVKMADQLNGNHNHKSRIGLPLIREITPQRDNKLSEAISMLGYRYRY